MFDTAQISWEIAWVWLTWGFSNVSRVGRMIISNISVKCFILYVSVWLFIILFCVWLLLSSWRNMSRDRFVTSRTTFLVYVLLPNTIAKVFGLLCHEIQNLLQVFGIIWIIFTRFLDEIGESVTSVSTLRQP